MSFRRASNCNSHRAALRDLGRHAEHFQQVPTGLTKPWHQSTGLGFLSGPTQNVRARAGACAVFLARRTEDVLVLLQGWRGLIQGIRAGGHGLHQRGPDTRSAEVSVVSTRSSEGKNGLAKLREKQVLEV